MVITKEGLTTYLKEITKDNLKVSSASIDDYVLGLDIEKIEEEERSHYTFKVWDKIADINGVPAENILKSLRVGVDRVVLIAVDDKINIMQDINHETGAFITSDEDANTIGENLIAGFVKNKVINRCVTGFKIP